MKQILLKNLLLLCSNFIFIQSNPARNYTWVKGSSAGDQWIWMKGRGTQLQSGTYGTLGTPETRFDFASWINNSDNLRLFGAVVMMV